jgi:tetratricopeptide (TPR) repeat protein
MGNRGRGSAKQWHCFGCNHGLTNNNKEAPMMRNRLIVLFLLMHVVGCSGVAIPEPFPVEQHCLRGDTASTIAACSAIIQSGHATTRNLALAFANRGQAYRAGGQFELAIQDYEQAVRLVPDDGQLLKGRGEVYAKMHLYWQAIGDFDTALRRDKDAILRIKDPVDAHLMTHSWIPPILLDRANALRAVGQDVRAASDTDIAKQLSDGYYP